MKISLAISIVTYFLRSESPVIDSLLHGRQSVDLGALFVSLVCTAASHVLTLPDSLGRALYVSLVRTSMSMALALPYLHSLALFVSLVRVPCAHAP